MINAPLYAANAILHNMNLPYVEHVIKHDTVNLWHGSTHKSSHPTISGAAFSIDLRQGQRERVITC